MKRVNYINLIIIISLAIVSCNKAVSQKDNDLATINAPQGTTQLVEKTMIYKYKTDELKMRSTSTFTFNENGNFLSHLQEFPEGEKVSQKYTYDDKGRVVKIIDTNTRYNTVTTTNYEYQGENPLTILATVENGKNFVPKVIQYFDGEQMIKQERYDGSGSVKQLIETNGDIQTTTLYDNNGNVSSIRKEKFNNGSKVETININPNGSTRGGVAYELDDMGNMTHSWILDENLKREKESFGYYYEYDNNAWTLRIGREIRDYGSGRVANVSVREVKGATNASITEQEIKEALKKIKT